MYFNFILLATFLAGSGNAPSTQKIPFMGDAASCVNAASGMQRNFQSQTDASKNITVSVVCTPIDNAAAHALEQYRFSMTQRNVSVPRMDDAPTAPRPEDRP